MGFSGFGSACIRITTNYWGNGRMKHLMAALLIVFVGKSIVLAGPEPSLSYVVSMENDAQFIESASALLAGVANMQRTILERLEWRSGNPEFAKIKRANSDLRKARVHL